jgi:hypothetical protein
MRRALLLAAALASSPAAAQSPVADASIETVLTRIAVANNRSRLPLRVYYRASSCEEHNGGYDPIAVPMRLPTPGLTSAAAIRDMFADSPRVRVTEDSTGAIRVVIDDPPTALMQQIISIHFNMDERFSPGLAMIKLETNAGFSAAQTGTGVSLPPILVGSVLYSFVQEGPHLPRMMRHTTVDAVLDRMSRTFRSIVVYSVCPDGRTFMIREASGNPPRPLTAAQNAGEQDREWLRCVGAAGEAVAREAGQRGRSAPSADAAYVACAREEAAWATALTATRGGNAQGWVEVYKREATPGLQAQMDRIYQANNHP